MSPAAAQALDERLEAYESETKHQLIVYIGKTTGDAPIEDWAVRAFEKWKVGRKGIDDGLVLFIMADDRKLRIEVGYGLEGQVPDVTAFRIINEVIVPKIRGGDPSGAVVSGMDAVIRVIGGEALPAERPANQRRQSSPGINFLVTVIIIVVFIFFITHPSLAVYLLLNMLSGSRGGGGGWSSGGGGWSSGGGGFSGGGGRSGGGGASGSW